MQSHKDVILKEIVLDAGGLRLDAGKKNGLRAGLPLACAEGGTSLLVVNSTFVIHSNVGRSVFLSYPLDFAQVGRVKIQWCAKSIHTAISQTTAAISQK